MKKTRINNPKTHYIMADNPKVKGIMYGKMQAYLNQNIDQDMLYFITDKGLLYRGKSIVVPTKFIDVVPDDEDNPKFYTFTIEAYADDPENPERLVFDVYNRAAVNNLIQGLSNTITGHVNKIAASSRLGHVKLSDAVDDIVHDADYGLTHNETYAATPKAVATVKSQLIEYINNQIGNISSGLTFKGTYGLQTDNPDEYQSLDLLEAAQGDMYICISNMTGVHYHDSEGTAITNGTLAPGDYIICMQAATVSQGTLTAPANWSIVANPTSNAVTTTDTLTDGEVIVGNGTKTVKKLTGGSVGSFLRKGSNGKAQWLNHPNTDHGIAYGECASLSEEHHKTVDIEGYSMQKYGIVAVRFANEVYDGDDLSIVDGNTTIVEQVPIIYHGNFITKDIIDKGDTATFMYVPNYAIGESDAEIEAWVLISVDRAPNNTPTNLGSFTNDIQGYGTCTVAASTSTKSVSMPGVTISKGSVFAVRFSYSVNAGASLKINGQASKPIRHRNADITSGQILGSDTATFIDDGNYYRLLSVDKAMDSEPTAGHHNLVDSDAIYNFVMSQVEDATLVWKEMV